MYVLKCVSCGKEQKYEERLSISLKCSCGGSLLEARWCPCCGFHYTERALVCPICLKSEMTIANVELWSGDDKTSVDIPRWVAEILGDDIPYVLRQYLNEHQDELKVRVEEYLSKHKQDFSEWVREKALYGGLPL